MTSLPRKGRCSRTCREGPGAGPAFLWLPGVRVPPARHSQSARLEPCLQTRARRERSGCRRRAGRMWVGGSRGPAAAFRGPLGAQGRWSHFPVAMPMGATARRGEESVFALNPALGVRGAHPPDCCVLGVRTPGRPEALCKYRVQSPRVLLPNPGERSRWKHFPRDRDVTDSARRLSC